MIAQLLQTKSPAVTVFTGHRWQEESWNLWLVLSSHQRHDIFGFQWNQRDGVTQSPGSAPWTALYDYALDYGLVHDNHIS